MVSGRRTVNRATNNISLDLTSASNVIHFCHTISLLSQLFRSFNDEAFFPEQSDEHSTTESGRLVFLSQTRSISFCLSLQTCTLPFSILVGSVTFCIPRIGRRPVLISSRTFPSASSAPTETPIFGNDSLEAAGPLIQSFHYTTTQAHSLKPMSYL